MLKHKFLLIRVLCRAIQPREQLAWRHYTVGRHGTCIGFHCERPNCLPDSRDGRNEIDATTNQKKRSQNVGPVFNEARAPPEFLNLFAGDRL